MSAGTDVARMLTMVPWLLERPGASVAEAAESFGVSARTVRRDLSHLDFCGLPGLGGGALFDVTLEQDRIVVTMADELRRPLRLTAREALRLVLALQAVDEAFGDELPSLRSAIDKVRQAAGLPPSAAIAVGEGRSGWLSAIRDALRDGRQVRISYQGRADDAPRDRVVDPWQLDVTADGWYLHGHDVGADGHRVYRLDRIADLQSLDTPVEQPRPRDDLPTPRFEPGDDAVAVRVRLGPDARWLADAFEPEQVREDGDHLVVDLQTDAPTWVARLLLMGAPEVEVITPENVADQLAALAHGALGQYQD